MANKELNIELLKLAGFEGDEVEEFLPGWLKAVDMVGFSDEDIRIAKDEYIPKNWDIQYRGIRKLIGAYFRELVEITKTSQYKAEGKPIIYGVLPAITTPYAAFKKASNDEAYVCFPDLMLVTILNSFFHRADMFLRYAEDLGFTYGCRHCPLNKTRLAGYAKGILSSPDVIWSWGFNCDEGPKTDEMIQCMIGEKWNYIVSRLPHDTNYGEKDDSVEERVRYLASVIKTDMDKVSEITGIYPKPEHLKAAIDENNRVTFKVATLVSLCCKADPPVLGGNALPLFQEIFCTPFNCGVKYLEEALDILTKEIRQAIKEGKGILPKGAPKLGSYFVPFTVPWVDRMFRDNGIAVTFSECLTPSANQLSPSKYPDDPYMSIAENWLKYPLGQNMGYEVASMVEKIRTNKPDGMFMGFFDFDRWLGAHHKMAAELVEKETGVPHYYIEADFWDDRDYSEEALRTRIESISQIVHMKKEMNG